MLAYKIVVKGCVNPIVHVLISPLTSNREWPETCNTFCPINVRQGNSTTSRPARVLTHGVTIA